MGVPVNPWCPVIVNEALIRKFKLTHYHAAGRLSLASMVALRAGNPQAGAAMGMAGADWDGWLDGLAKAAGCGRDEVALRFVDVRDHVAAYARQVVGPALALSDVSPDGTVRPGPAARFRGVGRERLAGLALHSGRTARRWLEDSGRWHGRRTTLDALRAGLPGEVMDDPAWKPCLPNHSEGDMSIRVLTTVAELVAEGAGGPDASGMPGLSHCVGGYGPECRSGESRILGIVRHGPDGDERRSTVEFTFRGGGFQVAQHLARDNRRPDEEDVAFLETYEARLRARPDLVRHEDLEPVHPVECDEAGYDWRHPGNCGKMRDAWDAVLPRALRGLSPSDYADMAQACIDADPEGKRHWFPRSPAPIRTGPARDHGPDAPGFPP